MKSQVIFAVRQDIQTLRIRVFLHTYAIPRTLNIVFSLCKIYKMNEDITFHIPCNQPVRNFIVVTFSYYIRAAFHAAMSISLFAIYTNVLQTEWKYFISDLFRNIRYSMQTSHTHTQCVCSPVGSLLRSNSQAPKKKNKNAVCSTQRATHIAGEPDDTHTMIVR